MAEIDENETDPTTKISNSNDKRLLQKIIFIHLSLNHMKALCCIVLEPLYLKIFYHQIELIKKIFGCMYGLKLRAVQENKRFSKVAEDALRQYLRLPKASKVYQS